VIVATHEIQLVEKFGRRRIRLEGGRLVDDNPGAMARA
jgi:ABC-type ATPase involved in cell division